MQGSIFISYSRKDLDAVKSIKEDLEANGFSCWMDVDGVESGTKNFVRKLVPALDNCMSVLFFISADSQRSEWTAKELGYAERHNKRIVLLRFNDDALVGEFDFRYGGADIIDWRRQEQKEKLLKDLSGWMAEASISNAVGGVVAVAPKMIRERPPHLKPFPENPRCKEERQRTKGKRSPRIDLECHYRSDFMRGFGCGYLLVVKNRGREPIDIAISVSNGRRRKVLRGIVPGRTDKEFGSSIGLGWSFKDGDRGTIKVVGYSRMLKFEIDENGSVSWHE